MRGLVPENERCPDLLYLFNPTTLLAVEQSEDLDEAIVQ